MSLQEAKRALDKIIRKSRVHLYKPIQIAEILYNHRIATARFDLRSVESYRNPSKRWRDQISRRLVGRISTSSARFQDNIFETNAMPPRLIADLGVENERLDRAGIVEKYIYAALGTKLGSLQTLADMVDHSTPSTFNLNSFIRNFTRDPGLKRSVDKAYEIAVYALFDSLVFHLGATITLKVPPEKLAILRDFEDFTKALLGITSANPELHAPARLYRAGVTNAADRGLDIWANFGPAVQVKHISLTEEAVEEMASEIAADKIVIVCQSAEERTITRVLHQVGYADRIQGVITQQDLERWYRKCFSPEYGRSIGTTLLERFRLEFAAEFPGTSGALEAFMTERGYNRIRPLSPWTP